MTLVEILAACATRLSDPGNVRWTPAELTLYATEGQGDMCQRAHLLKSTATLAASATTPVTAFYTLPSDLTHLPSDGIRYRGQELTERPEEYFNWRDWDTQTANEPTDWYRVSLTEIRIWPYAVAAVTPGYLKANYARMPLATMGASPEIPAAYHMALVYYAVGQAYLKNGPFKDLTESQIWQGRYEAELAKAMVAAPEPPAVAPNRRF